MNWAENAGFKVTKQEIEITEPHGLPIPAAVKFKLGGGTIEITGRQEFVEKYLDMIKDEAYSELAEGIKAGDPKEIRLLISKNLAVNSDQI